MNPLNTTEREELLSLREENRKLQEKIDNMENSMDFVEEIRFEQSDIEKKEIKKINSILKQAEDAKREAINYSTETSREKLRNEVRILQTVLKKAKLERKEFQKQIKEAKDNYIKEKERNEEEQTRYRIDREILAKIIKDDRDNHAKTIIEHESVQRKLKQDKAEVIELAKSHQLSLIMEVRKLTRALVKIKKGSESQVVCNQELSKKVDSICKIVAA